MAIPNKRKVAQLRAHIDHELGGLELMLFSRQKVWRESRKDPEVKTHLFGRLFQAKAQRQLLDYFDLPSAAKSSDSQRVSHLLVFADQQIDNIELMLFSSDKMYKEYRATPACKTRLFGRLFQAKRFRNMFDYIAEMSPEDGKY